MKLELRSCYAASVNRGPEGANLFYRDAGLREVLSLALLLITLGSLFISSPLYAETDRLSLPSLKSALAPRSLLLDVSAAGDRLFAAGERGHIIYSDDGGLSWQQSEVPVSSTLTAIGFSNPDQGWAVGHDGVILNTTDAGLSWKKRLDGFQVNVQVVEHYRQLLERMEEQLQSLEDQGSDTELLEEQRDNLEIALEDAEIVLEEGPAKPFLDLLFLNNSRGWVIGSYGLFFETRDGGASWSPRMELLDNPDGFHLNSIIRGADGSLYIAGEAGVLFRSRDKGNSWERLISPYEGSFYSIFEIQPSGKLLVTGLRGRGYFSEDQGDSWQELDMATKSTLTAITQLPQGTIIAAGSGGVVTFSQDQGRSFQSVIQPGRKSYSAILSQGRSKLVMVGQGGAHTLESAQLLSPERSISKEQATLKPHEEVQ